MPHRITPCIKPCIVYGLFCCLLALCPLQTLQAYSGKDKVIRAEAKQEKAAEADAETKLVLQSLKQRYENLGSWESNFTQTEKSPGFAGEIMSEGYFKFVLPNQFHLATRGKSLVKKFVSNGKAAIYIEDTGVGKPSERYFAREFKNVNTLELERYLLFFRGLQKGEEQKEFKVTGKVKKPNLEITLVPNGESDFSEVTIVFHNAEEFPKELLLKDALGGETNLKILTPKKIKKVDPSWFDLSIPKGAKIEK